MGFFDFNTDIGGLLGNRDRSRGPYDTPSFYPGPMPDVMPDINAALAQNAATPQKHDGFFDKHGLGLKLLGSISDAVANASGLPGGYMPGLQQQRMMQQDEQRHQRDRQEGMSDWQAKQQWEMDHPKPDMPGIADETRWFYSLPPEQQKQAQDYMKLRYPGQFVPPSPIVMEPGDTIQGGSPSGGGGAPPVGTVVGGMKFKGGNHRDPSNWEPAGGASPSNGSGGFQL